MRAANQPGKGASSMRLVGGGLVSRPAVRTSPLLHLRLEHVPAALHRLVADPLLDRPEGGVVAVVELLDDLERPTACEHVGADELVLRLLGQVVLPGGSQPLDDVVEHLVGMADELVEGVEVPSHALDVLECLAEPAHRPDQFVAGAGRTLVLGVDGPRVVLHAALYPAKETVKRYRSRRTSTPPANTGRRGAAWLYRRRHSHL